jgi:hypothetical protein
MEKNNEIQKNFAHYHGHLEPGLGCWLHPDPEIILVAIRDYP